MIFLSGLSKSPQLPQSLLSHYSAWLLVNWAHVSRLCLQRSRLISSFSWKLLLICEVCLGRRFGSCQISDGCGSIFSIACRYLSPFLGLFNWQEGNSRALLDSPYSRARVQARLPTPWLFILVSGLSTDGTKRIMLAGRLKTRRKIFHEQFTPACPLQQSVLFPLW